MSISGISNSNLFELWQSQNIQSQGAQGHSGQSTATSQRTAFQEAQDDFQQLGQDLQSGNLAQAQQDFATLSTALSAYQVTLNGSASGTSGASSTGSADSTGSATGTTSTTSATASSGATTASTSPLQQAFSALEQDLQSGNLSGAQQDFLNLQQALQQYAPQPGVGHHHHHHHNGKSQGSSQTNSQAAGAVQQDFDSLATALQSGNLSNAQTAFASLQKDLQQLSPGSSSNQNSSPYACGTTQSAGQSTGSTLNVTA